MPIERRRFAPFLRQAGLGLALAILCLASAAPAPAAAAAPGLPPIPPGMARIWFYRDYEPYETMARPYVRLNGAIAGISEPGGAFYRDVAPGAYAVTVDSDGTDVNQFVTVFAVGGQQVFVKVLALNDWDEGGGGRGGGGGEWRRDTFYTWQIAPQAAVAEIARMPLYNGG